MSILPCLNKPCCNPSRNDDVLRSATFLSCRSQVMEFITAALQSTDKVLLCLDSRLRFTVNLLFEVQVPEIALLCVLAYF